MVQYAYVLDNTITDQIDEAIKNSPLPPAVQEAIETTKILDETLNNVRRTIAEDIESKFISHQQQLQNLLNVKIKEAVTDILLRPLPSTSTPSKTAINGIYFRGLGVIRKIVNRPDDAVSVLIQDLLTKIGSVPYYTDVIALHPKSTPRKQTVNRLC